MCNVVAMRKRSSKRRHRDLNELAASIVDQSTDEAFQRRSRELTQFVIEQNSHKNPAAVALGKLGGLKGGKARAASLSAKRRQEIARAAAAKRWKKS
jgi:hypothetical protein